MTCTRSRVPAFPASSPAVRSAGPSGRDPSMADETSPDRTQLQVEPPSVRVGGVFPEIPGYAIRRELGRGGMGVVYEARQVRLDRTVAVKLMRGADPLGTARVLVEGDVRAAGRRARGVEVW